jgi:hypothetical protein
MVFGSFPLTHQPGHREHQIELTYSSLENGQNPCQGRCRGDGDKTETVEVA